MNAVLLLWRARLRRSWRALAVLALLFGLGGGVALSVASGARRTAGVNDAVYRLSDAPDLGVAFGPHDPTEITRLLDAVPGVGAYTTHIGFQAFVPSVEPGSILYFFAHGDDPVDVDRPILLQGRFPAAADEAMLNEAAASRSGLNVGDELEILVADLTFTDLRPTAVEIVGVGLISDEVVEDETAVKPAMLFSRHFAEALRGRELWGNAQIKASGEAGVGDVASRLADHGLFLDEVRDEDSRRVEGAIRPLIVTMGGLAVLATLTTIGVVGQAMTRVVRRSRADALSLTAAGCRRSQLLGVDLLTAATVCGVGGVLALAGAVAASPLFPVGHVRRISQLRGVDVDAFSLATGIVVLAGGLLAVVGLTSWRRQGSETRTRTPGFAPGLLGARPAPSTGVRFATGRRGAKATVVGAAAGLAVVMAALTFNGSLDRLVDDPALAGFDWDVMGRISFLGVDTDAVAVAVAGDPAIERVTAVDFTDGTVAGVPTPVSIWTALEGTPWPPVVAGRTPAGPGEMLVGSATLERLGLSIGDRVTVDLSPTQTADAATNQANLEGDIDLPSMGLTIVGSAVSPAIGLAGTDTPRLDEGALIAGQDVEALVGSPASPDAVLFGLADGAGPEAVRARFPDGLPNQFDGPTEWFTSAQPSELGEATAARTTMTMASAAVLVAAVATVVHSLLGFVRERRGAFAVLTALGFTPRQLRATVLWQSGLMAVVALAAAFPVGIAIGRWLWRTFAEGIGVVAQPVVPLAVLAVTALLTVLVVQVVALVPAQRARRTRVPVALKAE